VTKTTLNYELYKYFLTIALYVESDNFS